MPAAAPAPLIAPDLLARGGALLGRFAAAGFVRFDPPILQPADIFLDLSGETIRRSMFLTVDEDGRELCLRPELTIPVARAVIAEKRTLPAAVSYLGPVFRFGGGDEGEVLQAGVESFGRTDVAAADAEILALALEACAGSGIARPVIRLGDVGLFAALLDALPLAPALRRRLLKEFGQGRIEANLRAAPDASPAVTPHAGVLAALAGADPAAARALVTDLLSIAGISTVGGRSVSEIAERFLEQAARDAGAGLSGETAQILHAYLAISGAPDAAEARLRKLAAEAELDLAAALDAFAARNAALAARGVAIGDIAFASAFGRPLDYYSGMVFELHDPSGCIAGPLAAGGRYDRLLPRLAGAPSNGHGAPTVAAVGCAVWVARLAALSSAEAAA